MKIYKKHILCVIVGMTCLATILSFTAITGNDNLISDKGYKLVFSDEFNLPNGSQPDSTKWKRCRRNPSRWARWISDSKDVVYIKNGRLVCRAIPNKDLKADTAKDAEARMKQLHDNKSLPDMKWIEVQSKVQQAEATFEMAKKNLDHDNLSMIIL